MVSSASPTSQTQSAIPPHHNDTATNDTSESAERHPSTSENHKGCRPAETTASSNSRRPPREMAAETLPGLVEAEVNGRMVVRLSCEL